MNDRRAADRAGSASAPPAEPGPAGSARSADARLGVLCAGGAFFIWGMVALYFRALRGVSAFEIIAHRVLWSVVFLLVLVGGTRGFAGVRATLGQPRLVARLALTAALVASNWLTFVWAVNAGRLLDTSLGYFITPQVNVLLGFLFLHERLRGAQWLAVLLALLGVANQVWLLGQLPWISLVLALTFGSYGLFRKQIPVDAVTGLLVETLVAAPFALAFLGYLQHTGRLGFAHQGRTTDALLAGLGIVTAVPLLLFGIGARRLRLATVGFLQYLAPTITFLLAVLVYREPLGLARVLTFVFIWSGIGVYAADSLRR